MNTALELSRHRIFYGEESLDFLKSKTKTALFLSFWQLFQYIHRFCFRISRSSVLLASTRYCKFH